MFEQEQSETQGSCVRVEVNVTKIVQYVCITGVLIVSVIFGTRCLGKLMERRFS